MPYRETKCPSCEKLFRPNSPVQIFCAVKCRWRFNDQKRRKVLKGERKEKIPSLERLRMEDRVRLMSIHNYELGDQVEFNGMKGTVVLKIGQGKTVYGGWLEVLERFPEARGVTATQFGSKRKTTTFRYFVRVTNDKGLDYFYCPKLSVMCAHVYNESFESKI